MSVVHQAQDTVMRRIVNGELAGAYGVGLHADAEDLGLQAYIYFGFIIRLR